MLLKTAARRRDVFSSINKLLVSQFELIQGFQLLTRRGIKPIHQKSSRPMQGVSTRVMTSRWMRFFLSHDPRPVLARIEVPVLALPGLLALRDQRLHVPRS